MEWTFGCPTRGASVPIRGDVGILEFLDGSHAELVVVSKGVRRDGDDRMRVGDVVGIHAENN
jgi:hypothetical protein